MDSEMQVVKVTRDTRQTLLVVGVNVEQITHLLFAANGQAVREISENYVQVDITDKLFTRDLVTIEIVRNDDGATEVTAPSHPTAEKAINDLYDIVGRLIAAKLKAVAA